MSGECKTQKKWKGFTNCLISGIKIDLCTDLCNMANKYLEQENIQRKNWDDPLMDYFRLKQRLISNHPRRILKAQTFSCPKKYQKDLNYIEKCITIGQNIHPFMTRNLKNLRNEDLLLSDWGIYHLHLSRKLDPKRKDGFMKRSPYLLLVRIEEDVVYFIKIISHNAPNLWALKEYIEIIRDNWPELIENNLIKDAHLIQKLTDADYSQIRKAHVSSFVELDDGSLYGMIGGGYASDGTSIQAVQSYGRCQQMIKSVEKALVTNLRAILQGQTEWSEYFLSKQILEVHLRLQGINILLLEIMNTDLIIIMNGLGKGRWKIVIIQKENIHRFFMERDYIMV